LISGITWFIFAAMKFFAFTMAFLFLGLSVLPCADEGFVMNAGNAKTAVTEQHNHQQEQEHKDACSPFCHCTCCAGFSINHPFAIASSLILVDNRSYTSHQPGNLFEYSSPIWQPPQLKV
jgi:hypothetical protein